MPTHCVRQRRAELMDPAQDRPSAQVDPAIGQHASDTFGRGAHLQVLPDSEQDDVAWEAMASDEADRLARGVTATRATGVNGTTTLVVAVASEIG